MKGMLRVHSLRETRETAAPKSIAAAIVAMMTLKKKFARKLIAASAAVGLAIGAMSYFRCIHPPGGATALTAVIGGESTRLLGYQFVLAPVLLNALILLGMAVLFNNFVEWRRYPATLVLGRDRGTSRIKEEPYGPISHEDFVYALSEIDSFIDVREHDLLRIYELATGRARGRALVPQHAQRAPLTPYSKSEIGEGR